MYSRQRTAGDGMECKLPATESKPGIQPTVHTKRALQTPATRLIEMVTKSPPIIKSSKTHQSISKKTPKFVPYEPYTGAVRPIVSHNKQTDVKKSRNQMDINTLISQISKMDTSPSEFKPREKLDSHSYGQDLQEWNKEKSGMVKEIDALKKENEALKDQVKQQVQVNKELKTMLVASMGEDLETQVQLLNDDKRHLANALLSSAQHLSTHQEQTEWLAGQCEVWRSKFLASSLMIEELADWKRALGERTEELQQVIKEMLDERCRVREMNLYTYKNLASMHDSWLDSISRSEQGQRVQMSAPQTANLIDLSSMNLKISENISGSYEKSDINGLSKLPMETEAEKKAEEIISKPIEVRRVNDGPVKALVHHAHTRCGNTTSVASCVHCSGQVRLL